MLAVKVTADNEQDRAQVKELAQAVQAATEENVQLAYVDQGYTGTGGRRSPAGNRIASDQTYEAKRGFVLVPRRWVVERSFARRLDSAAWPATTNDSVPPWRATIGWPSLCSCFAPYL